MEVNYQFRLKEPKTDKLTSIRLLFYKDGKTFVYGAGKSILPGLWDFESQRPTKNIKLIKSNLKSNPQLKTELENIENRINKIINLSKEWFAKIELTNDIPDLKNLRKYLNSRLKIQNSQIKKTLNSQVIYLDETIRQFIRDISNGTKLIQNKKL